MAQQRLNKSPRKPRSARDAYYHALRVRKGRWPEGEAAILRDPYWACRYARDVIKARWPEAEQALLAFGDGWQLYYYARDVIRNRWPEAEALMLAAESPRLAWSYSKNVLRAGLPPKMHERMRLWSFTVTLKGDAYLKRYNATYP